MIFIARISLITFRRSYKGTFQYPVNYGLFLEVSGKFRILILNGRLKKLGHSVFISSKTNEKNDNDKGNVCIYVFISLPSVRKLLNLQYFLVK